MARKDSHSKEKYQEMIRDEINLYLRRGISDPRLTMLSVTKVSLLADYSEAKVFWDSFNSAERGDIKKALKGITSKVRSHLAKVLELRHTPQIKFIYDSHFEDEMKITQLLHESKTHSEEE